MKIALNVCGTGFKYLFTLFGHSKRNLVFAFPQLAQKKREFCNFCFLGINAHAHAQRGTNYMQRHLWKSHTSHWTKGRKV